MSATRPLSWLSRWLDRRIDARIAVHEARRTDQMMAGLRRMREARTATAVAARLPGHDRLAEEATADIHAATAIACRMRSVRQSPSPDQEEG